MYKRQTFAALLVALAVSNAIVTPALMDYATLSHPRAAPAAFLASDHAALVGAPSAVAFTVAGKETCDRMPSP